jgi:hypothetical protein
VRPEDVTPEVWDYVFLDGPAPSGSGISGETLAAMRREFEFWYPWDLRVRALALFLDCPGLFPDFLVLHALGPCKAATPGQHLASVPV